MPVVEAMRIDSNMKTNNATLYTLMPQGFQDLSMHGLTDRARRERVVKELGRQIGEMHLKGVLHGDLRRPNILWNGSAVNPKVIFLDFETAKFSKGKLPENMALDDVRFFTRSVCGQWEGIGSYSEREMRSWADAYCKATAYDKEKVLHNIRRSIPAEGQQTVRDDIRERLERNAGLG